MKFGMHVPQIGRKASADAVSRAARQAEDLGYDGIWVNDHLAVPAGAPYPPSASFFEPLITLTWAAAATSRVALGTSVLVLPLRHPVHLAKELATLDLLSGGRLILGVGVGWLEEEFAAVGVPFEDRGPRSDDIIRTLRACWTEDPVSYQPEVVTSKLPGIRTLPQPGRQIPVWVGGNSGPARRRALELGDGWHGLRTPPGELAPAIERMRAQKGPDFTISIRLFWDALADDTDELRRDLDGYAAAGVDWLVLEPRQKGLDDWLKAVEAMWKLAEPHHG
jgi:probable F420-dependent oxidoreductase